MGARSKCQVVYYSIFYPFDTSAMISGEEIGIMTITWKEAPGFERAGCQVWIGGVLVPYGLVRVPYDQSQPSWLWWGRNGSL